MILEDFKKWCEVLDKEVDCENHEELFDKFICERFITDHTSILDAFKFMFNEIYKMQHVLEAIIADLDSCNECE